ERLLASPKITAVLPFRSIMITASPHVILNEVRGTSRPQTESKDPLSQPDQNISRPDISHQGRAIPRARLAGRETVSQAVRTCRPNPSQSSGSLSAPDRNLPRQHVH